MGIMEAHNSVNEADSTTANLPPLQSQLTDLPQPESANVPQPGSPSTPIAHYVSQFSPVSQSPPLIPSSSQSPVSGILSSYILPSSFTSSPSPTAFPPSTHSSPQLQSPALSPSVLSSYVSPPTMLASSQPPPNEMQLFPAHCINDELLPDIIPQSPPSPPATVPTGSPLTAQTPPQTESILPSTVTSAFTWRYDPLASPDWDLAGPPGTLCAGRVKKDLSTIFLEPLPGIFVVPEESNLFKVHCLVIGPFDTPYEGGFFHFLVRFGPQYPLHPPRVRLLTTGGDTVRFNPNLYKNGKVCLSILGTWSGPAWSPASNLSSVLLSLQSLLNERPYHNEPGYEKEHNSGDSDRYNTIITHETIRVSVVQQLEGNSSVPSDLKRVMKASFLEYYDHYVDICERNLEKDGQTMDDPFGGSRGKFQYGALLKSLKRLKGMIESNGVNELPVSSLAGEDEISSISEGEEGFQASDSGSSLNFDDNDEGDDEAEEEVVEGEEVEDANDNANISSNLEGMDSLPAVEIGSQLEE